MSARRAFCVKGLVTGTPTDFILALLLGRKDVEIPFPRIFCLRTVDSKNGATPSVVRIEEVGGVPWRRFTVVFHSGGSQWKISAERPII